MRLVRLAFLLILSAVPAAAASASPGPSPRQTVERFDSLLQAGDLDAARALCTGQALRLFPLLAEAEGKLTEFLDTARSRDTVLEEKRRGSWAALKIRSVAVFTRPLMGLNRLESLQAVHLFRESAGTERIWKIADFEDLPNAKEALVPRSGPSPSSSGSDSTGLFLPASRKVPDKKGATRLRLEVSLRSGDSLPALPEGPGQKVLSRGIDRAVLETRRPPLPVSSKASPRAAAVYLASTRDLDLKDPLLRKKAAELKKGPGNRPRGDLETAGEIYRFVSESFRYKLGASLFSDSRTALRELRGDCSEAAVLTAALLRAAGIPSRVVLGFATIDHGVFIGHAWAEAYAAGEWIGVDAALREFPAGANRVALARLSGEKDMQSEASNLMMGMLSNLDIEITEAWADTVPLKLKETRGGEKAAREFLDNVLKGMGE